ncbi:MAG: adenylate/guanylate cyclase domain-containing protein, partial [Bacteroidia bacterium]|nr:adenylate/guanylate cyclase domain-containing protein [Bacteroidia bacterium]
KFDEIVGKHGLEKIKTVGDAYMCAGGLPFPSDDHPQKMIMAAQEMLEFVKYSKDDDPEGQTRFDVRIGINTGPVVAGVVGTKKFAYDIWGDAVNVASRMESNAEIGMINISDTTYQIVKDKFDITYRGEFAVKNRGTMKMYAVK